MDTNNWLIWCRLCAKNDATHTINIEQKQENAGEPQLDVTASEESEHINIAKSIEKFLQIKLNGNELPNLLCTGCHKLLLTMEKFAERVCKVQEMYQMFQQTKPTPSNLDTNAIRIKYGLAASEDDYEFVLFPEVQLYELKPQLNQMQEKICEEIVTADNPLELLPEIKQEDELIEEERAKEIAPKVAKDCEADDLESTDNDDGDDDKDRLINKKAISKNVESKQNPKNVKTKKTVKNKTAPKKETNNEVTDPNAPYTCSECKRTFKRYQDYSLHMKRTHKTKLPPQTWPCTQCNRVFSAQYLLGQHIKMHLPLEQRLSNPCDQCDKKFLTKSNLKRHVAHEHLNERNYVCEECGTAVRSFISLKTHMLIHSGLNPFKCELCDRAFKEKSKLKNHMEVHENKKFECSQCGRLLNSRLMLRRHLLVHSDVRRFKCDYCGSAFKRSRALKIHLIMHTGLKPYVCNFCDRSFSTGSSCRLHKRTIHPEELAAYEAAGGGPPKPNLPNLKTLKEITKNANLKPVGSQHHHLKQQQRQRQQQQQQQEQKQPQTASQQQQTFSNLNAFLQF